MVSIGILSVGIRVSFLIADKSNLGMIKGFVWAYGLRRYSLMLGKAMVAVNPVSTLRNQSQHCPSHGFIQLGTIAPGMVATHGFLPPQLN